MIDEVMILYNPNIVFSDHLPAIAVRGVVFLPASDIRVEIGRDFSKNAISEAEANRDGHVVLVFQENPLVEEPEFNDLVEVGILARISVKIKLPNGNYKIKFEPITRVKLNDLVAKEPFYLLDFTSLLLVQNDLSEEQVLLKMVTKELLENAKLMFRDSKKVLEALNKGISSEQLADLAASELRISENERIKYLKEMSINQRLKYLLEDIDKEKTMQLIENKINESVRKSTDQNQKEYYLREKMRAIQEELGDSKQSDAQKFLEEIEASDMPPKVKDKALKELRRYEYLSPNSAESNVVRTYLETLISIPWAKTTEDEKDINVAINKLEEAHYGLEKVKERIIEYLSVKMLTGKNPQTILCLAGPPGVGKTSLAKSIANALNREFVKTSLGGVHDEADVTAPRPHDRVKLVAVDADGPVAADIEHARRRFGRQRVRQIDGAGPPTVRRQLERNFPRPVSRPGELPVFDGPQALAPRQRVQAHRREKLPAQPFPARLPGGAVAQPGQRLARNARRQILITLPERDAHARPSDDEENPDAERKTSVGDRRRKSRPAVAGRLTLPEKPVDYTI